MPISAARAARVVHRAQLPFAQHVSDPRDRLRHPLGGILALLTTAMATGRCGLRDIEDTGA